MFEIIGIFTVGATGLGYAAKKGYVEGVKTFSFFGRGKVTVELDKKLPYGIEFRVG